MTARSRPERSRRRTLRAMVAAAIAAAAFGACNSDVTSPGTGPRSVALAVAGDSVVVLGDVTALVVKTPAGGPSRVLWLSSDSSVASVDDHGVVRGLRVGTASITASLSAPELTRDVTTTWPMTVVFAALRVDPPDSLTGLGESDTLVAWGTDIHGAPAAITPAIFTAIDPGFVDVTASGVVTARANGVARIVAAYQGLADTVTIRVHRVAKSVTFASPVLNLPALQRDTTVLVQVRDARDSLIASPVISWLSSDPSAITVSTSGAIRALHGASAVVTARVDTVVAQLEVRVAQTLASLTIDAGNGQSHTVGTPVPWPPTVCARDASGYPIAGLTVVFRPTSGGGSVIDSVQVTNELGLAVPGNWTLGTTPGPNTLLASSSGLSALFNAIGVTGPVSSATSLITVGQNSVVAGGATTLQLQTRDQFGNPLTTGGLVVAFAASGGTSDGSIGSVVDHLNGTYTATYTGLTAGTPTTIGATINTNVVTSGLPKVTVVAGAPVRLAITAGDAQHAVAGSAVPVPPTVVAYDQFDNPVRNLAATFTVTAGGGNVTAAIQLTDSSGAASVGAWTLGTAAGPNQLDVTASGLHATFTASGIAGPPAGATSEVTVSAATVSAGGMVTLRLRARDGYGNGLTTGGGTVVFTASGGSSTGTRSATSDNGDGTYTATFSAVTAGTATTIGATIDGVPVTSILPTITVIAGAPARLVILAGAGQQANAGSAVPVAPTVGIYDALDNPLAGIPVTFTLTAGGGSMSGGAQTTDGQGRAAVTGWTLGTIAGENRLMAAAQSLSATITATAVPGPASPATSQVLVSDDTVAAGSAVILMVVTRDQYGNQLATGGRSVLFLASGGTTTGAISQTTDGADGRYLATFSGVTAGTATTIRATIDGATVTSAAPTVTVTPGPPASLLIVAGNNQSAQVARAVTLPPAVRVRDAQGNAVQGAIVIFAAAGGSGSVAGGYQTSDATGLATVGSWTLGTLAGSQTLTVSAGGASVPFGATATPGPLSLSGTRVTVTDSVVASSSVITLSLQTADEYGNPIALTGRSVRFTYSGGTSTGAIAGTQSQGGGLYTAGFTGVLAGTPTTIQATVDNAGLTSPSPTVKVVAGPPVSIARWAGQNQVVAAGSTAPIAPAVFLKDAKNNPVPGVPVTFSISGGNGQVTGAVAVTDTQGVATVGAWILGTVAGVVNNLLAVGGGFSVEFAASVVAGPASPLTSVMTIDMDSVQVAHNAKVTLFTRDAYGNALTKGGAIVTFYYEGGTSAGTFLATADRGDGRYEVQFTGQTAGTAIQIRGVLNGVLVTTPPPSIRVWQ